MRFRTFLFLAALPGFAQSPADEAARLRALAARSAKLPLERTELAIARPRAGWAIEMVSSVAADAGGVIYLLQRGANADPVIAVNREGKVLRSWGQGLHRIPHGIRIDPDGNVWTVDADSSMVYKFTPEGRKLLEISVGEQPSDRKAGDFRGTTDIAFAAGGRIYIADGYGNARILEYNAQGKRLRQWGRRGTGPGEFHLPHAIAVDERGVIYVADRENGRIQRFDLEGKYLGEWGNLGKTFSLKLAGASLFLGTQARNEPNGSPGWLMKVDRENGAVQGLVESTGHHSVEVMAGELLTGSRPDKVLRFRASRNK